ncbi:acyltransferase [Gammaproteobacteria bacterium LSUCC0112]|nr:acyltransferase [Gammaproteobacteria bacterium LSUCC0112]
MISRIARKVTFLKRLLECRLSLFWLRFCGADIDPSVKVYGRFNWVGDPEKLTIQAGSTINEGVIFELREKITIGKNVRLSTFSRLHTSKLILTSTNNRREHLGLAINIKDNAWLASGAVVSPGVTVGLNSVLSANSVAISDIPDDSLFSGVPAVFIRKI